MTKELYPSQRLTLFDAKRVFSAPVTLLGTRLTALYIRRSYITFRDLDHVATLSAHYYDTRLSASELTNRNALLSLAQACAQE